MLELVLYFLISSYFNIINNLTKFIILYADTAIYDQLFQARLFEIIT